MEIDFGRVSLEPSVLYIICLFVCLFGNESRKKEGGRRIINVFTFIMRVFLILCLFLFDAPFHISSFLYFPHLSLISLHFSFHL